jgi:hypothetical protein
MSPLSKQILSAVDALPDMDQRQVLDFVDFLRVRRSKLIELQPEADRSFVEGAEEEDPLEYVDGVLVIKSQGRVLSGDLVNEMREDRMQDVGGW